MGWTDKLYELLDLREEVKQLRERNQELELENKALKNEMEAVGPADDMLDLAWGLIANAGHGDWRRESPDWIEAAKKWRDRYHTPTMHEAPKAPDERVKNLEATLRRVIKIAKKGANEYCDAETQAELRTAEAILENKI